jgi:hypothetical protein
MDAWVVIAVVIVLAALTIDRSRAYRVVPTVWNRLRSGSAGGAGVRPRRRRNSGREHMELVSVPARIISASAKPVRR